MNQEKVNSMFITLDGIDGVGKSTQMENLSQFLRSLGHEVLVVRDPGSSVVGAKLRQLLLESDPTLKERRERNRRRDEKDKKSKSSSSRKGSSRPGAHAAKYESDSSSSSDDVML